MGVALNTGDEYFEIGAASFFYSFFSNIVIHLEDRSWGSKYPHVMRKLYSDGLTFEELENAKNELYEIKKGFQKITPDEVIWDCKDLTKQAPWGKNISEDITDLSNYFVTSDGKDLFEVMEEALNMAIKLKKSIVIR